MSRANQPASAHLSRSILQPCNAACVPGLTLFRGASCPNPAPTPVERFLGAGEIAETNMRSGGWGA